MEPFWFCSEMLLPGAPVDDRSAFTAMMAVEADRNVIPEVHRANRLLTIYRFAEMAAKWAHN